MKGALAALTAASAGLALALSAGERAVGAEATCGGIVTADRLLASRRSARCPWPFKADWAALLCVRRGDLNGVFADIDGRRYAMNGHARAIGRDMPGVADLHEIEVSGPVGQADRRGPWIQDALALCR